MIGVIYLSSLYQQEEALKQELFDKNNDTLSSNGTYNSIAIIKELRKNPLP
jgi:hypothetical protein